MSNLVSIIIPCYNGEKTVLRCLESVLAQDYTHIEVIVVNDGSADRSDEVIASCTERFRERGMGLRLINQENQGLAGAINAGLAIFRGDYLCWIDCDDYLLPGSISKRLHYLQENPDIASVTSDAYFFKEDDLEHPVQKASDGKTDLNNPHQFENHLRGNFIFCCGCHMLRASAFLTAVPTRQIYPARRGQNWQMLLPVFYKFKQAYLDEPLYAYILYRNSMSAGDTTKEQYLKRYNDHRDIIRNTLATIDMPKDHRKKYLDIYEGIYHRQIFYLGVSFHDFPMILRGFSKLVRHGEWNQKDFAWLWGLVAKKIKRK